MTSHTQNSVGVSARRPLRRRDDTRMLGGVAGGTAQFFDVDVLYVRIGLVALAVFGGGGVVLYVAAWALIPEEGSDVSLAQKILQRARGHARRS
jgi:phage shock protein PspC (stress-responsive transcriptional regulator)